MPFDTDNALFDALMDAVYEQHLADAAEKKLIDDISFVLFKYGIIVEDEKDQMFQIPELLKDF